MPCCQSDGGGKGKIGTYDLHGAQVEPAASYWLECPRPCPIPLEDVIHATSKDGPYPFPKFPDDHDTVAEEIRELLAMQMCRDDPNELVSPYDARFLQPPPGDKPPRISDRTLRSPISLFLQMRQQPPGAVYNFARGDTSFPIIFTGRELARYFENETPGLAHRQALNVMIRDTQWSPPRSAWIWAILDVTLYSALSAAWYYKWLAGPGFSYRERPIEYSIRNKLGLEVIFDHAVNSTGSGDGALRKPLHPTPEFASPGTPRHPAYPSGHSTYSSAASAILGFFFPDYRHDLELLADNIGEARLWAGVHWRSDHVAGQMLGRAVACLMIEQLRRGGIAFLPGIANCEQEPPKIEKTRKDADQFKKECGERTVASDPGLRGPTLEPCKPR